MARHARAPTHHVNQAEVEGAIAGYFGVPASTPGISDLVRVVFPGVQEASRGNPAAWRSVVLGVLANHIGMARGLGLQGSELQRQLQIMRASNRTSADFVNALRIVQTLVAGMGGWSRVARAVDDGGTTNSNTYAALGGSYAADRLPMEMRRYVDRYGAHHVAAVGNYLNDLGMHQHEVHRYAGFFVGSSETVRHAIRDHVRSGRQITDADITNVNDARALIGAVQAGRITRDALPPSMQRLIQEMERGNVDLDNSESVRTYLQNNPDALERARQVNEAYIGVRVGMTREQIQAADDTAILAVVTRTEPPPPPPPARDNPPDSPAPPRQTVSTLDIG